MNRRPSGEDSEEEGQSDSKWTRRYSYAEMSRRMASERQRSRRLSDVELTRRLSNVGILLPPVDIHGSDSEDDVPEIDHSGPIHNTKRPLPPKHDELPSYRDLVGNEDTDFTLDGLGIETFLTDPSSRQKNGRRRK